MAEPSGSTAEDAAPYARSPRARAAGRRQHLAQSARSAAWWCRTAALWAGPSPRRAAARTPRPSPWRWRARRRAGATVYVTLEPCCHWGQTPPCTDALIAAGRGSCGDRDPRSRPAGGWGGHRPAARSGHRGRGGHAARRGRRGGRRVSAAGSRRGRPLVTLKLASTLDGRIATHTGREPLDHRRGGAPRGARAARPARRGDGRRRHRADRRSRR